MIKKNNRLELIDEYKPSKRTVGGNVKKLDWNECNLTYDEEFSKILFSSLSTINYSEYPNINNESFFEFLSRNPARTNNVCWDCKLEHDAITLIKTKERFNYTQKPLEILRNYLKANNNKTSRSNIKF